MCPNVPPTGFLDFEEIAASMNMTKSDDATPEQVIVPLPPPHPSLTHPPIPPIPSSLSLEQEATRQEFINSHIKRFDSDGDGKVSYAEGWGAFNKRMVEMVTHKQEL